MSVEEESQQKVGISGGFLSSIVQSDGIGGGIRLNLTTETIQSIFRTYPAGYLNKCLLVNIFSGTKAFGISTT